MKKRLLTILVLVFWAVPALAEIIADTSWVRRYNGPGNNEDGAVAIAVDHSNNVYVTGWSIGSGTNWDYATIKYYPNGDTAWVRRYNGPGNAVDEAHAIALDSDGNVYVTGHSYDIGTSDDYTTIKYTTDGDTVWVRRYNGTGDSTDCALAIATDSLGNVYVTGYSYSSETYSDFLTIKYSSNGDVAWMESYNGQANWYDGAEGIALDGSGNVYVTGWSESFWGYDYLTIKYYANGDTAWVRRYNGPANWNDWAWTLTADGSGNVYVTGTSYGGSATDFDFATIKYYSNGDTAWVRRFTGSVARMDYASEIAVDNFGNVYVSGWGWDDQTSYDYVTIKYYPNGDTAWMRRYTQPGTGGDYVSDIALDRYGNVYITGGSSGIHLDYATIKYSSNGDTVWVRRYNGTGNHTDYAIGITVDVSGNVYVTGGSDGNGTDYDYVTIKYPGALRGDTDRDGVIDLDDVVYLINYLYMNGYAPKPVEAGDTNCDGIVDVGDVIYLINYILKGGPEPSCI